MKLLDRRDASGRDAGLPDPAAPAAPRVLTTTTVIAGGLLAIRLANEMGRRLQERGLRMLVNAPPLTGNVDPRLPAVAAGAIGLGALGVAGADRLARRLPWRGVLWTAFAGALAWSVALAAWDGVAGFTRSVTSPVDYLAGLPFADSPARFISTFVGEIARYPSHVRAHPPGLVLVLRTMAAVGLQGAGWVAALEHLAGAASVPAVLIAIRDVAGEARARMATPFLVFLPAAVFWSSGDAVFLGVSAWAVALLVLATGVDVGRRRADVLALSGGALAGAGLFLSYGLVPLAAVPFAVAVARRRVRPLVLALAPVALWFAAFAVAGFWWFDGLAATREQYALSVARARPYPYFLGANLAALLIALGPAVWVALSRLRDRRLWWLVGGALVAVAFADLTGLSKAEVERIWLPFMPWIAAATAGGFDDPRACRTWLGVNVVWTLALQGLVWSPW